MMQSQVKPINKRLRLSGGLIASGLLVQAISLLWNHPLSFIAFVAIGGLLLLIGILVYLLTLVDVSTVNPDEPASLSAAAEAPQAESSLR